MRIFYPLKLNQVDLRYIKKLKKIFPNNLVGYSDHTKYFYLHRSCSTRAKIIEKHITISRNDGAPDSFFSLEENDLKKMVDGIRR